MIVAELLYEDFLRWLREDAPFGDITSSIIPDVCFEAVILGKCEGIVAGLEPLIPILKRFGVEVVEHLRDGEAFSRGDILARLRGNARTILLLERTILNILTHLCGIARLTHTVVEKIRSEGLKTIVAATRKTTPGLRLLEKYAVLVGGGQTHRLSLSDMILIKDNHIRALGGLEVAVTKAREVAGFHRKVEVEVTSVDDALRAAELGADIIMLDNMSPGDISIVNSLLVERGLRDQVLLEASGGITLDNVLDYARAGVDIVSMGHLTHSAPACDISLELIEKCRINP